LLDNGLAASWSGKGASEPMQGPYTQQDGRRLFDEDRAAMLANPKLRAVYDEEAAKKELWLQLVEARMAAGLTQEQLAERLGISRSQVCRIERRGYDASSLTSLRRYVAALGEGFGIEVRVRGPQASAQKPSAVSSQEGMARLSGED